MARNRQPVLKKCRALGIDPVILGVKKSSNRQIRPNANKKPTEYATQLREKQKAEIIEIVRTLPSCFICHAISKTIFF